MRAACSRNTFLAAAFLAACEASPPAQQQTHGQDSFQLVISEDPADLVSHDPTGSEPLVVNYVEQANGLRIPITDWDRGEQRYLVLNESGLLDAHEQTAGRIEHEGTMYDCRMDLVDSNRDGRTDLARLTVDYHVRRHREWNLQGSIERGRAILQDDNYDGIADHLLLDIYEGYGRLRGYDGVYERTVENGGHGVTMEYFLERWIIFVGGDPE